MCGRSFSQTSDFEGKKEKETVPPSITEALHSPEDAKSEDATPSSATPAYEKRTSLSRKYLRGIVLRQRE
jgi:hypothetical protein